MKRVLIIFLVSLILFGSVFGGSGSALSQWSFRYKADEAHCAVNGTGVTIYIENGVGYLSTKVSNLTKELREGMRITLNITSRVSPESVIAGIKVIVGEDVLFQKSLSTGSFSFQFYTTRAYNASENFTVVLYDYGGTLETVLRGIHIVNPKGGVGEGLFLTGIGISVVFTVLSILAVVMYSLKRVGEKKKKEGGKELKEEAKAVKKEVEKMEVNEEIVAAITGALSMYLGGKKFRIISVKPSNWKYFGRFRSMR